MAPDINTSARGGTADQLRIYHAGLSSGVCIGSPSSCTLTYVDLPLYVTLLDLSRLVKASGMHRYGRQEAIGDGVGSEVDKAYRCTCSSKKAAGSSWSYCSCTMTTYRNEDERGKRKERRSGKQTKVKSLIDTKR